LGGACSVRTSRTKPENSASPNKRMQLTKLTAAPVLRPEVPPCAPAVRMDGRTASQLIRGVRRTKCGSDQEKHEVTVARRRASMLALPFVRAGAARGERQLKLAGIAALGR
jgi:hypothetical protein